MSKLHSSKKIQAVLEFAGFTLVSQKGSHGKFENSQGRITILPMNKKEIPRGTFKSILRQAGISESLFD